MAPTGPPTGAFCDEVPAPQLTDQTNHVTWPKSYSGAFSAESVLVRQTGRSSGNEMSASIPSNISKVRQSYRLANSVTQSAGAGDLDKLCRQDTVSRAESCARPFLLTRRAVWAGIAAPALYSSLENFGHASGAELPPILSGQGQSRQIACRSQECILENTIFVTNRNDTGSSDFIGRFGSERAALSYGIAIVSVYKRQGSDRFVEPELISIKGLDKLIFLKSVCRRDEGIKSVTLFVHGYNNSFVEAVRAAAQLRVQIASSRPIVVFCWTSRSGYLSYFADQEEIEFAANSLRSLIVDLLRSGDIDRLDIIAHSLGARGVVSALKAVYDSPNHRVLAKVREIVYAAPDIDQGIMDLHYLPIVQKLSTINTTVYASDKDLAMRMSEFVHGNPRVGSLQQRVYIRPRIITVDVSQVDSSMWGHSSLFQTPEVASDLHYLLGFGLPPTSRQGLEMRRTPSGVYWHMT